MKTAFYIQVFLGAVFLVMLVVFGQRSFISESPEVIVTTNTKTEKYESLFSRKNIIPQAPHYPKSIPTEKTIEVSNEIETINKPTIEVVIKNKQPLSKEDIFYLQHPQYYLDALGNLEDVMVEDGFLTEEAKENFNSEDKVISFWKDTAFDYLVALNIKKESDRGEVSNGLALLKTIHTEEARELQLGRIETGIIKEVVLYISENILSIVRPQAQAQSVCFTPGGTPLPGVNLFAPCCNCFAGPFPIGCLNLICAGRAAIYDQTTGICGCG